MSFSLSAAAMRCFGSDPEVGASRSHVRSTPRTRRRRRHGAGQLGYWKAETPNVRSGWYITGDTMMRDEDNHFSFVGRNDDIITSSGYRIGPFDVESVVMEHPAVAEVAVIGKPDPQRTEIVKAVIVLRPGVEGTEDLKSEIQQMVRQRLSTHAYPREIDFIAALPKTPSGKIQRFILRDVSPER